MSIDINKYRGSEIKRIISADLILITLFIIKIQSCSTNITSK